MFLQNKVAIVTGAAKGIGQGIAIALAKEKCQIVVSDVDISGASGALINVCGGSDMTLEEARRVVETISRKLDEEARIIWGAQISEDLGTAIKVLLIVTGVKSSQIFGKKTKIGKPRK